MVDICFSLFLVVGRYAFLICMKRDIALEYCWIVSFRSWTEFYFYLVQQL